MITDRQVRLLTETYGRQDTGNGSGQGWDERNPPTDEHIRRAISSAYYALFHALATSNADVLIGPPQDQKTAEAALWTLGGVPHGPAYTAA